MRLGLCIALVSWGVSTMVHAQTNSELTMTELMQYSQTELDSLYAQSPAGVIPNGSSDGKAVFFADSLLTVPTTLLASLIWQGKVFDSEQGVLVNRVFGFHAIKAEVYKGQSFYDGAEAIIVDYQNTSLLVGSIRDEIRQVGEQLYLGRAYFRMSDTHGIFVLNFILDFSNT